MSCCKYIALLFDPLEIGIRRVIVGTSLLCLETNSWTTPPGPHLSACVFDWHPLPEAGEGGQADRRAAAASPRCRGDGPPPAPPPAALQRPGPPRRPTLSVGPSADASAPPLPGSGPSAQRGGRCPPLSGIAIASGVHRWGGGSDTPPQMTCIVCPPSQKSFLGTLDFILLFFIAFGQ